MRRLELRSLGASALGALASLAAAGACVAQSAEAAAPARELPRFELTAYGAYRFGGEFNAPSDDDPATPEPADFELHEGDALGLIFNIRASAVNTQWEILYAHQQTEVDTLPSFAGGPRLGIDVDYLQFGGTYLFDEQSTSTVPFIALTAGVAHFDPAIPGTGAETYWSGSIGGGVQLRADKRIGVRLEARAFASLIDSNSALFCATGPEANRCALSVSGTALFQFEGRAGVVIRF